MKFEFLLSISCLLFVVGCTASGADLLQLEKRTHSAQKLYFSCGLMQKERFRESKEDPENIATAVASKCAYEKSLFQKAYEEFLTAELNYTKSGKVKAIQSAKRVAYNSEQALKKDVITSIVEWRLKK